MKKNKVIIWSTDVIKLMEGKTIGGIAVQMYFWAQVFAENDWKVFSFAKNANKTIVRERIEFRPVKNIRKVNLLLGWWYAFKFILTIRPELLICRGRSRRMLPIALFSRLFHVKLVFFGASDSNFKPDKFPTGSKLDRWMYIRSISHIRYFVTQNRYQHDMLFQHFGKKSLLQYNIWGHTADNDGEIPPKSDVVWVANLRKLKRAEWMLDAARKLPVYHFVLAGGRTDEVSYYNEIQQQSAGLPNVTFLGGKAFSYVNELIGKSKILLCSSTYEGFPNTFLQAWSKGLPVISTVDPSGIITRHHLGEVVTSEKDLKEILQRMLEDNDYYDSLRQSVRTFFTQHHSAQVGYENVINYITSKHV